MCNKADIERLREAVSSIEEEEIIIKSLEIFDNYINENRDRRHYLNCVSKMRELNEMCMKYGFGVLHQLQIEVSLDPVLLRLVS